MSWHQHRCVKTRDKSPSEEGIFFTVVSILDTKDEEPAAAQLTGRIPGLITFVLRTRSLKSEEKSAECKDAVQPDAFLLTCKLGRY